jgi:hypothetical protein
MDNYYEADLNDDTVTCRILGRDILNDGSIFSA